MNRKIVAIYLDENFPKTLNGAQRKIKNTNPRIYNALFKYTDHLLKTASFTERVYNIRHNYDSRQKCSCGNFLRFKGIKAGYGKKCSKTCQG